MELETRLSYGARDEALIYRRDSHMDIHLETRLSHGPTRGDHMDIHLETRLI